MGQVNKLDVYKELQKELDDRKKRQVCFTADSITIEYDSLHHLLYADWIGYQSQGSIMEGCEKLLEAVKQYKVQKVLNDNSHMLGIWTPASYWLGTNWLPRMKEEGVQIFAWVYSPSVLSQVSTNESIQCTPFPDLIKTFYDVETARKFLTETA